MPIKSMIPETSMTPILRGFPRLGKFVKGAERSAEDIARKRPGKDLNFFRFKPAPGYEYVAPLVAELYGAQPDTFDPLILLGRTADDAFNPWLESWGAGSLKRRCDGEIQVLHYIDETATISHEPIACELLCGRSCDCKAIGRFAAYLPALAAKANVMGYVTFETHSKHDILELDAVLKAFEGLVGNLFGISFRFSRTMKEISTPRKDNKTGKMYRAKTSKSLFTLQANGQYTADKLLPALAVAIDKMQVGARALPAGDAPLLTDGKARERLSRPGPRRIGASPLLSESLIDPNDPEEAEWDESDVDNATGEIETAAPPTDPGPDLRHIQNAKAFTDYWRDQHALTNADLLAALKVKSLREWTFGRKAADAAVNAYIDAKTAPQQQAEPAGEATTP